VGAGSAARTVLFPLCHSAPIEDHRHATARAKRNTRQPSSALQIGRSPWEPNTLQPEVNSRPATKAAMPCSRSLTGSSPRTFSLTTRQGACLPPPDHWSCDGSSDLTERCAATAGNSGREAFSVPRQRLIPPAGRPRDSRSWAKSVCLPGRTQATAILTTCRFMSSGITAKTQQFLQCALDANSRQPTGTGKYKHRLSQRPNCGRFPPHRRNPAPNPHEVMPGHTAYYGGWNPPSIAECPIADPISRQAVSSEPPALCRRDRSDGPRWAVTIPRLLRQNHGSCSWRKKTQATLLMYTLSRRCFQVERRIPPLFYQEKSANPRCPFVLTRLRLSPFRYLDHDAVANPDPHLRGCARCVT